MSPDNTPIPPGFKVTYCDPGIAEGVEPAVCHSTGRKGAPSRVFKDLISEQFGRKPKPPKAKKYTPPRNRKEIFKERAEEFFS